MGRAPGPLADQASCQSDAIGRSDPRIRRYLRRRGIRAVIPTRKDQRRSPHFDKPSYRRRNVVERCIKLRRASSGLIGLR